MGKDPAFAIVTGANAGIGKGLHSVIHLLAVTFVKGIRDSILLI
jgi:hypothetical protein